MVVWLWGAEERPPGWAGGGLPGTSWTWPPSSGNRAHTGSLLRGSSTRPDRLASKAVGTGPAAGCSQGPPWLGGYRDSGGLDRAQWGSQAASRHLAQSGDCDDLSRQALGSSTLQGCRLCQVYKQTQQQPDLGKGSWESSQMGMWRRILELACRFHDVVPSAHWARAGTLEGMQDMGWASSPTLQRGLSTTLGWGPRKRGQTRFRATFSDICRAPTAW